MRVFMYVYDVFGEVNAACIHVYMCMHVYMVKSMLHVCMCVCMHAYMVGTVEMDHSESCLVNVHMYVYGCMFIHDTDTYVYGNRAL